MCGLTPGQRTELGTDGAGYISEIQNDPQHPPYIFSYASEAGLLRSMTDPRGAIRRYDYLKGRLVSDESPDGRIVTLNRTDVGDVSTVTLSETEGGTKTFTTDVSQAGKLIAKVTFPDGSRNQSTQTLDGVITTTLADGRVVVDSDVADPVLGTFAPVTSTTVTTPAGLRRAESVAVSVTSPTSSGSPYDWTQRVTRSTVNNQTTVSTFDRATRTDTTVTPVGRSSSVVLDTLGRPVREAPAGREPTVIEYDSSGRVRTVTQGVGTAARSRQYGFHPQTGFLSSTTVRALNEVMLYARDDVGRASQITSADSQITGLAYDEVGNLVNVTPPGRSAHAMNYTPADLVSRYIAPLAATGGTAPVTQFDYTKHRHPKLITRADGQTILSTYRADGKLASVVSPRGTSLPTYNATSGLLTGVNDVDGGALAFTYDGSLSTSTSWSGSARPAGTVAFTYDNNFWLDLLKVNGTTVADYSYDNDGLVVGTGALIITRSAQTGDIGTTTLDNVTTTEATSTFGERDDFSAAQAGNSLFHEQITTRDAHGRCVERIETVGGTATTYGYGYDAVGRLRDVRVNGVQSVHYEYDANGNRNSRTTAASSESGTYDGQDRLTSYGSASYTYTTAGELATKSSNTGNTTYDYDVFGNLRSVVLPDGRTITYEIDALQRRIGKRVNGARQYGLLYQSQLVPVALLDADNAVIGTFVYATRGNVPDYMVQSGVRYRFVTDERGSVRLVVRTSDGSVVQRLDYDEFGRVTADTNPGFQPFGFAGGIYDGDTGLVRFGARDYDAVTGRWTAKDPVLFEGGDANLYSYAGSNPVTFIDPSGLFADGASAAAALAQLVGGGGTALGAAGLGAVGGAFAAGAAFGYGWYSTHEDEYQEALDMLLGPANPELGPRRDPWDPDKENRKKQGRENGQKKKKNNWKFRTPPREPPRHTPGKEHRKKFCK